MALSSPASAAIDITSRPWLSIIGIGEDGIEGLSPIARRLIGDAVVVVGGARHLALAGSIVNGERIAWPSPIEAAFPRIVALRGSPVVILASGDPFHFGIGKLLAAIVAPQEFVCMPQPSAFSLAAAQLGWALQDVRTVSLHGRALASVIRHLQPGARVLALSWDGSTPGKLAQLLCSRGLGDTRMTVLENMGGPGERVQHTTAKAGVAGDIGALNTIALEVIAGADSRISTLAPGRNDASFENDGQLTKREVRAITIAALEPHHAELLWDIGLGSGSIAIEWLLCDPSLQAIGIEENAARAAIAARNAASLGTPELRIVHGRAPEALQGLPTPDAVFIGGGLGDGVLDHAWRALKPGGRIVANAVTLEAESTLLTAFQQLGGDLTRIEVARADGIGGLHGWRPAFPVTQWRAVKP
ncbi:MAG: precorrin-6y C5,15-methyltransferase (decarboxylating) subunit CbiE [Hyphomicrobium sp.]|nr:precorrin-6y C5,15-methyltransferase (decarboxylating) subunit CbiE [Hyphomicrobium sp.]